MESIKIDSVMLFTRLAERIRGKADVQQRINAHILAKHGAPHLGAFIANGSAEADKIVTLGECLLAVTKGDYSGLLGAVPQGQAEGRDAIADAVVVKPQPVPVVVAPVAEPVAVVVQPVAPAKAPAPGSLEAVIAAAVTPFLVGLKAGVDVDGVKAVVKTEIDKLSEELKKDALEQIEGYLAKAKLPARQALEVRVGKVTNTVEGLYHYQLPQLVTWVGANVPVWLWGQAGAGKTSLVKQVAKALGIDYLVVSIDPTITVGKLLGFRNHSNGQFIEGLIYRLFKDGGLLGIDEIDTGDEGVLASLNSLLANEEYTFPNGEVVQKHKDFRVVAGGNTKGMGATAGYTARRRLDAATLDRFAVIELVYDEGLEMALVTGRAKAEGGKTWSPEASVQEGIEERWCKWVQKVRGSVGGSVLISPRASILGGRALQAGVKPSEVADATVFRFVNTVTRSNIISSCGEFV